MSDILARSSPVSTHGAALVTSPISRAIASCRMRVIAGHHDHLDAGIAAPAHGLRHFGAWWILEADERSQHQVRVRLGEDILAGQQAMGEGQHSKSAIRHLGGDPGECRTRIGRERFLSAITLDPACSRQQLFGRALDEQDNLVRPAVHGDETLALGLEGDLVDAIERRRGRRPRQRSEPGPAPSDRQSTRCRCRCWPSSSHDSERRTGETGDARSQTRQWWHLRSRRTGRARRWFAPPCGSASACRSCRCRSPWRIPVSRRSGGDARASGAVAIRRARHGHRQGHRREQALRHVRDDDAD